MRYLICENCGGYYELQEGETIDDFYGCDCGGNYREAEYNEVRALESEKDKLKAKLKKNKEKKKISELISRPIPNSVRPPVKRKLINMVKNGKSTEEIEKYYREIIAKTQFIESRREEYITEAKLADKVYKAYITDGISRLEKINGRFLASLSIKTDVLIEQNNRIIKLLEANLKANNALPSAFCPKCGSKNINETNYCEKCGTKI